MHISEGVLNAKTLIISAPISAIFLLSCIKNVKYEQVPKIAALSAIFFLASFIHIPIGVTSVHLILSGLVGAFLGYNAFLAIFIALFLQGLLFGYGGLSTLGINSLIIGIPAFFGYWIYKFSTKKQRSFLWFFVGFVPILLSAILLSLVLALNSKEFYNTAYLAFLANIPIMFIEGIISFFALKFIKKVAPEFLK